MNNGEMNSFFAPSHKLENAQLVDAFGRDITYLRLSVTDRCDFRCIYCMAEDMTFLPRADVLSLEEMALVARAFSELGVKKIRVTGGEPLIRRDVLSLFSALGEIPAIEELCLTTNGSRLEEYALPLKKAGVDRINISLDTLNAERFTTLTRHGSLQKVMAGIDAAAKAGFERIKINSVLMRHYNLDEVMTLAEFALERNFDISFIEEMPLGEIQSHARDAEFISSAEVRKLLEQKYALTPVTSTNKDSGPSRYWQVAGFSGRIGFISPHSENFCSSCNRVRVSASGRLLLCLGNEHSLDLRQIIRQHPQDVSLLKNAIVAAMTIKPEKHEFNLQDEPQILRFMNATGG